MPVCNIYSGSDYEETLLTVLPELRSLIAQALSNTEIQLTPEEVSIRLLPLVEGSLLIGRVEIEVYAHAFPDRVERQDTFCRHIARFLEGKLELKRQAVQCWLVLSELGHSWEP